VTLVRLKPRIKACSFRIGQSAINPAQPRSSVFLNTLAIVNVYHVTHDYYLVTAIALSYFPSQSRGFASRNAKALLQCASQQCFH